MSHRVRSYSSSVSLLSMSMLSLAKCDCPKDRLESFFLPNLYNDRQLPRPLACLIRRVIHGPRIADHCHADCHHRSETYVLLFCCQLRLFRQWSEFRSFLWLKRCRSCSSECARRPRTFALIDRVRGRASAGNAGQKLKLFVILGGALGWPCSQTDCGVSGD